MTEIGLEIDNIDKEIIQIIQQKPNITHTNLTKKIGLSQPTIGMKIRKLERQCILSYQVKKSLQKFTIVV